MDFGTQRHLPTPKNGKQTPVANQEMRAAKTASLKAGSKGAGRPTQAAHCLEDAPPRSSLKGQSPEKGRGGSLEQDKLRNSSKGQSALLGHPQSSMPGLRSPRVTLQMVLLESAFNFKGTRGEFEQQWAQGCNYVVGGPFRLLNTGLLSEKSLCPPSCSCDLRCPIGCGLFLPR